MAPAQGVPGHARPCDYTDWRLNEKGKGFDDKGKDKGPPPEIQGRPRHEEAWLSWHPSHPPRTYEPPDRGAGWYDARPPRASGRGKDHKGKGSRRTY